MRLSAKHRTYALLEVGGETTVERIVDWVIMTLILINVIAVVLSTVDPLYARYELAFEVVELVSVAVFTVEYIG